MPFGGIFFKDSWAGLPVLGPWCLLLLWTTYILLEFTHMLDGARRWFLACVISSMFKYLFLIYALHANKPRPQFKTELILLGSFHELMCQHDNMRVEWLIPLCDRGGFSSGGRIYVSLRGSNRVIPAWAADYFFSKQQHFMLKQNFVLEPVLI